jgi:hypothetical protein
MPDEGGEDRQKEYVDLPYRQFEILKEKYKEREIKTARIPLPINCQQLWAQHKYSVLARDPEYYRTVGPLVSRNDDDFLFKKLSREFVELLAVPPARGRLMNAVQHMWGYVSSFASPPEPGNDLQLLMDTIRTLAFKHRIVYLMESTALSDLSLNASGGQGAKQIKN